VSAQLDLFAHPIILSTPRHLVHSAWNGHIPFGMFLIELLAPSVMVELGTHSGASYCAFCQAITELGLTTAATAVDTWQGDEHSGSYGSEIFTDLRAHHDPLYGHFSKLFRGTFDEAATTFETGSVDLLHIDGLHTYEAVSHDYEKWLPKMSNRGVMLFHDIAVTLPGFGVQRFWNEIKTKHSHLEMLHCSGLGVLVTGKEAEEQLRVLLKCTNEERQFLNQLFEELGSRLEARVENERLMNRLRAQQEISEKMERDLIDFYQLARNPIVRLVRGTKRYGVSEMMRRGVQRMMVALQASPPGASHRR
jgi:O-antigen biosynthesis protein